MRYENKYSCFSFAIAVDASQLIDAVCSNRKPFKSFRTIFYFDFICALALQLLTSG